MATKLLKVFPFYFFAFFLFSSPIIAQGDLMIMPKRLVFDGSQRSQEINLANTGTDTATYAISFVQYVMTEKGDFIEVEEPQKGQRFATNFLRYFPRRVSLPPNEAQTIRVQLTRTGNLEPGEYRSHMYFRAVEERTALGQENAAEDGEGISIQINAIFGISIPIIIKEGESTTSIELTDIKLISEEGNPKLSLIINRSGNMSVYGDLSVNHISSEGTTTPVGIVKGISVYSPNQKRIFSFTLQNPENVDLSEGKLEITYMDTVGKLLADAELELN